MGIAHHRARAYGEAARILEGLHADLGSLGHYAAYYHVRSLVLNEDFDEALASLEAFGRSHAESRFRASVDRMRIESLMRLKRLDEALALTEPNASKLDEPTRLYLAGRIKHLANDRLAAVSLYRQVYYDYPMSDEARAAETHLNGLRSRMGSAYPKAPALWRLNRAEGLFERRKYSQASAEYGRALSAGLNGADRDLAIIGRGAADYRASRNQTAYAALAKARPKDPELDAERLYLLCALERRMGITKPMHSSLEKLARSHAGSPWYEEALLAVGNYYYLRDDRDQYSEMFRRLVKANPHSRHAPYANWKVCWRAWLDGDAKRRDLLTDHVRRFPADETSGAALYWLGRLSEREGKDAEAQGFYRAVTIGFPLHYYGFQAKARIEPTSSQPPASLLEVVPRHRTLDPEPDASTRAVLDVARTLSALGLDSLAAEELSRVDYTSSDAHHAGLELARIHSENGSPHRAVRALKRYAYGYLRFPIDAMPLEAWRHLYPMGWEDSLRARSERHGLDPYLVASLIRQESEFNPSARSSAGALGLMQVMPATGRTLFRRLGIPSFSSRKLTVPDTSLRLGTFYLKEALARLDGNLPKALAAYNAGESRIPKWMALGPFADDEEFTESIPFSETRGYVKAILRNRAIYALLYER